MAMTLDNRHSEANLDVTCEESAAVETITVQTTRFGTFEADADLVITFPDGMIGFENCKRFLVVHHDENNAFRWLQAVDEPAIAFPIVEPTAFRSAYTPTIADSDARFLELTPTTPMLIFTIVSVPPHNPQEMTANLLGPLVINGLTRRGKQVIVQDEGYTTRHKVMEEMLLRATASTDNDAIVTEGPPKSVADKAEGRRSKVA